jgi:uncharacterized membrane protein YcaP (DUF421 family)
MLHPSPGIQWPDLMLPHLSWLEKILRPFLVYLILLIIFRLASRRELAQATLFDFLIILLISNVVQNAMIGEDSSVLGAAVGVIALVLLSGWLNHVTARSRRARILLEGSPVLLIRDGNVDDRTMRRQGISRNDLFCAVRKQGLIHLKDVGFAILELDGSISIIRADAAAGPQDCLPPEIASSEGGEDRSAPISRPA